MRMGKVKGELLYEGKAKKMFAVEGRPEEVWVEYKDSLTAFNAQKKSSFVGKGSINAQITSLLYQRLALGVRKSNGVMPSMRSSASCTSAPLGVEVTVTSVVPALAVW